MVTVQRPLTAGGVIDENGPQTLVEPFEQVRDGANAVSLPRLMAVLWHPHRRGAASAYAAWKRATGWAAVRAAGAMAEAGHSLSGHSVWSHN